MAETELRVDAQLYTKLCFTADFDCMQVIGEDDRMRLKAESDEDEKKRLAR